MKWHVLLFVVVILIFNHSVLAKNDRPVLTKVELSELWKMTDGLIYTGNTPNLGCRKLTYDLPDSVNESEVPYAKIKFKISKRGQIKKPKVVEMSEDVSERDTSEWIQFLKSNRFVDQFSTVSGKKSGPSVTTEMKGYFLKHKSCHPCKLIVSDNLGRIVGAVSHPYCTD